MPHLEKAMRCFSMGEQYKQSGGHIREEMGKFASQLLTLEVMIQSPEGEDSL